MRSAAHTALKRLRMLWSFSSSCVGAESGEDVFVDVLSGSGGSAESQDFTITTGTFVGKWLAFSLAGQTIAPGFYLLTTLETESQSARGCVEKSVNFQNGVITDVNVRSSNTLSSASGRGDIS